MVFRPGPAWWVKIADFGISKRLGGMTDLRTVIGTEAYMAPEVRYRLVAMDDGAKSAASAKFTYSAAVDIWALGQIIFRIITQKYALEGRQLLDFVDNRHPFPLEPLSVAGCSLDCCDFIRSCMKASPGERVSTDMALKHAWIEGHEYIDDSGYISDSK